MSCVFQTVEEFNLFIAYCWGVWFVSCRLLTGMSCSLQTTNNYDLFLADWWRMICSLQAAEEYELFLADCWRVWYVPCRLLRSRIVSCRLLRSTGWSMTLVEARNILDSMDTRTTASGPWRWPFSMWLIAYVIFGRTRQLWTSNTVTLCGKICFWTPFATPVSKELR
jgi:hypothetical protein